MNSIQSSQSLSDLIRFATAGPDTILILLGILLFLHDPSTLAAALILIGLGWRAAHGLYDDVSYVDGEGERLQPWVVVRCALLFCAAAALVAASLWPQTI